MPLKRFPLPLVFGLTLFLSAGLSFLVQPMVAKALLPHFGGSPAVWTGCMLFFQTGLLLGYGYAHFLSHSLRPATQVGIHLILMALLVVLRTGMSSLVPELDPHAVTTSPTLTLIVTLFRAVGLTFLALATTAPLLLRWYVTARGPQSHDPYFLYAASNAGSLAALAGYPLWIERRYPLAEQNGRWGLGFWLFSFMVALCGISTLLRSRKNGLGIIEVPRPGSSHRRGSSLEWLVWVVLTFIPSSLLLGVTTYVTTDLAAIPLLWAVPLGIYLGTFIIVFSRFHDTSERVGRRALPLLVMVQAVVMAAGQVQPLLIPLHLLTFTAAALVCHGALATRRPVAERLTSFFLAVALGGALGGVFNALIAPYLFNRLSEYPLAIVWACLALSAGSNHDETLSWRTLTFPLVIGGLALALFSNVRDVNDSGIGVLATMLAAGLTMLVAWTHRSYPVRFALTIAALLAASGFAEGVNGRVILRERNFFGVISVTELEIDGEPVHRLFHGSTLHGQQNLLDRNRREPQTYFERSGPIGQVFQQFEKNLEGNNGRVAVTGVGAGSLAAYARKGQRWTFFEIDPEMDRVARDPRFFTYLRDSRAATLETIVGDARMTMARAEDAAFDLIILDAFSSDAIPAHLLTREALAQYLRKLSPGGLIAINITNRYLDLAPVVAALAANARCSVRVRVDAGHTRAERERGKTGSIWALLATDAASLGELAREQRWTSPKPKPNAALWTDDFTSLVDHLRLGAK